MITLRTPRFWLLTTAALIFGSALPAHAQGALNYQTSAPTMVAAAPGLPSVPAEQIARDVMSEFNPRTGARELIGAPFDPFEEDPSLAGSVRLRSADGGVSIDGQPLPDGAIVEMDFYYNSPSNDPFGGRNYSDASFVNGELAPVVSRDTRVLECSTRVENVVYNHAAYYDRRYSSGIYRPHRHYTGHSGFGFGFGSNYFGPGYRSYNNRVYYGNNRSYGYNRNRRTRSHRPRTGRYDRDGDRNREGRRDRDDDRNRDVRRDRDDDRNREGRRNRDDRRVESRDDRGQTRRSNSRRLTDRDIDERLSRIGSYGLGRNRATVDRDANGFAASRAGNPSQRSRIRAATPRTQPATSQSTQPGTQGTQTQRTRTQRTRPQRSRIRAQRSQIERAPNETSQREPSVNRQTRSRNSNSQRSEITRAEPRRPEARRTETRRTQPARAETRQAQPKRKATKRAKTPRAETKRSQPKRSSKTRSTPRRRTSTGGSKRRVENRSNLKKNFFPNDGYGGRTVMSSKSVDCAREDKLRIFIPNARLDAARFDGLTLIALDAQGGETPIYLPPNYIEGFRMAATGRVSAQSAQPQTQYTTPQYRAPEFQRHTPRPSIEAAPCPSGTTKQTDGTCLQAGSVGYPYR